MRNHVKREREKMADKMENEGGEGKVAKYARWIVGIGGFLMLLLIAVFSIYRKCSG
jgi:uncharacterized integral membrane protein